MAKKVALIHPQTGLMKSGYYGFSWTFFILWLVRTGFSWRAIYCFASLSHHSCYFWNMASHHCLLYNKQYMTRMLEKGYVLNDTEQINEEARRKIGVQKL
jgi:hypothetical protein